MRKILSISLILLAVSLLSIMENSWKYNRLNSPYRIDLYSNDGIMEIDDLSVIYSRNPDLLFAASAESTGIISVDDECPVAVLAVSTGYNKLNPIRIVRGAFYLKNAVLIRKDLAYEVFNSDDVAGETIYFNDEAHLVSGIFELPPLIAEVSSVMPDIITSIGNSTLDIDRIQIFQINSDSPDDSLLIESFINSAGCTNLKISSRYSFFCQLKKLLYFSVVLLIVIYLVKILRKDFSERKKLFQINIRKFYFAEAIAAILKTEPLIYIIPILLIILLLIIFRFYPYLPPEIIEILTPGGVILWPLRFFINITDNINPVIILPRLYEAAAFVVIFLLFLPGYLGISQIKTFFMKDALIIPLVNIVFTLLFLFLKLEPVFDFKINVLLLLLVTVSAAGNKDYSYAIFKKSS